MKLTITKDSLIKLCTQVVTVAKAKSTMPVLQCVLLETDAFGLKASASDIFQEIVTHVPAEISAPGVALVNAKDLFERARTLPSGPITMALVKDRLTLTSGKRKHTMPTRAVEEFPPVVAAPAGGFTISTATMQSLIRRTKSAVADDPNKGVYHGLFFEFEDGRLRAVATNGHRLAWALAEVETVSERESIIVPLESADALFGLLGEGDLTMSIGGERAWFTLGEVTFCSKLLSGTVPPWKEYTRTAPEFEAIVDTAMLKDALQSVEKASPEDAHRGFVTIDMAEGMIKVSATGKGDAEDEVDCRYDGKEVILGGYCAILVDALSCIEAKSVRFNVGGELDPVWIRSETEDDCLQLVMPARL